MTDAPTIKATLKSDQRLVLYDASCGLCVRSKKLLTALDAYQLLVWVPMETPELEKHFANLPDVETRRGAITVWKPPGEVNRGPLAMADIYEVLPWPISWLGAILRWRWLQPVTTRVYAFIAANRHKWLPPVDEGDDVPPQGCKL